MRLAFVLVAVFVTGTAVMVVPEFRGLFRVFPVSSAVVPTASALVSGTPDPTASPGPSAAVRPTEPPFVPLIDRPGMRDRLQVALDEGRLTLAAPGVVASVLFADGRQWTGVSGVADIATGRPLTAKTPFAIASISKTFLSAEILALVDEGKVGLDQAVAPLLRGVLVGGRAIDSRITIRQLLDHTSGLGDYLISRKLEVAVLADKTAVWTPTRALTYAGRPVGVPGAGYHYANTNYVLLGMIAEQLTGRTLVKEFRARFFEPLGLTTLTYQGVEPPTSQLPTAYQFRSASRSATPIDVTDGTDIRPFTAITTAAGAAGSLAASAPDIARWARALYGGQVLPADDIRVMVFDALATQHLRPGYPYGLGVQVLHIDGRVSYGHSGSLGGARSVMRWFPQEGIAIAVMTNQSRFDPAPILRDLFAVVAPGYFIALPVPD